MVNHFGGNTITVQGGASNDETAARLESVLRKRDERLMKQLEEREQNRWRTQ
jgi:hypothetical protein